MANKQTCVKTPYVLLVFRCAHTNTICFVVHVFNTYKSMFLYMFITFIKKLCLFLFDMFMRKQKVFCTFFNTCIKNGVFLYVCFILIKTFLMFFQNMSSSPSSLPSSSFSNLIFNYWTSQLDFSTLDFSKSGFSNIGFCKIGIFNIGFFPKYMLSRIVFFSKNVFFLKKKNWPY